MKSFALLAALAALSPVVVVAQQYTGQTSAGQVVLQQPVASAVLRTGTPIVLKLSEGISTRSKLARINDRVRLEVAEAVTVNGVTVIPVGSHATGELTEVRNKGMWGKSGRLVGRVLTVDAGGRTIRLSGTFDSKGGTGTAAAVATSAIVFLPAGFFMTGKSADMPAGTTVKAFVDEDVPLTITGTTAQAPSQAQPMVVRPQ